MYNHWQGVWVPPNENVKLPVAIKVLNEGSSSKESRELLDEARIMASVDHPYCLRVVAVCLAPRLMLVVPLMPLGSLLDYLHKNVANVDSKRMLNWATQIARVSRLNCLSFIPWAYFCRAELCISVVYAVVHCLSLCPSVTFVYSVEMNKHIFNNFSPAGSHSILVFLYQMLWHYSDRTP